MAFLLSRTSLVLGLAFLLSSCAGYQLGSSKPAALASISSFHVPVMKNETLFVRAEVMGTNTLVDALVRDGSYAVTPVDRADAVLLTAVEEITYRQVRSVRLDTLRPEELDMQVKISWQIIGENNTVIDSGTARGTSRFFVADNLQTSRRNAIADAMRDTSERLVARLAHGF